jgi:hypothetical protein
MRRKINILIVQGKQELLDLISKNQKEKTLRSTHDLWAAVNRMCPSLASKSCHWAYDGISQELRIREGRATHWFFRYKF